MGACVFQQKQKQKSNPQIINMETFSLILNLVLGSGLIVSLATLKSTKQKASAEAESTQVGSMRDIIQVWKTAVDDLRGELEEARQLREQQQKEIESLRRAVSRLTSVNSKILKMLDKITHENLDVMMEEIKRISDESN